MNSCRKCGVYIIDSTEVCPLCHCVVEPNERTQIEPKKLSGYPDIRVFGKRMELVGRIFLFLSIVIGAGALILNIMGSHRVWWSLMVIGGLAYAQLVLFFVIENDHAGYRSKTLAAAACGIAYVLWVDYLLGFNKWSINYAVPSVILVLNVMILIVMFVNRRNWQSYLLFQLFMVLCSGLCVLLYLAGVITNPVLSLVALAVSALMFLGTFIIGGRRAANELKRRFHVM